MKKLYISTFFAATLCSAQTTITKAYNDPVSGDVVNNYLVNGIADHSAIGNAAVFNNSGLSQGAANVSLYTMPTAAETSLFPGSILKMISTGNTSLLKTSAAKLELTGVITPDVTLNFSADNATLISYPATFGYSETDNARGTFTSSLASGLIKGTVTNTADASGTLLIGNKTYPNVLRIKSVQNFNLYQSSDTFYLFPIGVVTSTSYSYYDNLHKFPLLSSSAGTITAPGISQSTGSSQALNEVFLSTAEILIKKERLAIYPNPVKDILHIKANAQYSKAKIYTADGILVKTSEITSGTTSVEDLPRGVYFIHAAEKNKTAQTAKFIKN